MKTIKKTISVFLIFSVFSLTGYLFLEPEVSIAATASDDVVVSQTVTGEITISDASNETLSGDIGGMTGGTGNSSGNTTWTVTTNDTSGFSLTLKKDGKLNYDGGGTNKEFDDYASTSPLAYAWNSAGSGETKFGFNVTAAASTTDVVAKYKDNGADCGSGNNVSDGQCWNQIPTTTDEETIVNRSTWTPTSGVTVSIKFRAEAGSNNHLESGTYQTTITATATTN